MYDVLKMYIILPNHLTSDALCIPPIPLTFAGADGELAQVAGCPWTMRDSGASLAPNRWQGELSLTVSHEGSGGGMAGGHLLGPDSPPNAQGAMDFKVGHKERGWTGEYLETDDMEEEDGFDEEEEELEEDQLDEGEEISSECAPVEEEEGMVDWHDPHESLPQMSQYYQNFSPLTKQQDKSETRDVPERPLWARLHGLRQQRLKRWRRLRASTRLRFRLAQNWKTWRQRAQWVGTLGYRRARRWRQYNLYSSRQKRDFGSSSSRVTTKESETGKSNISWRNGGIVQYFSNLTKIS